MSHALNKSMRCLLLTGIIVVSGCTNYIKVVRDIALKYDISEKEANQCYSSFGEDTEDVLDWVKDNESWPFGYFSEDCEDLIEQLPLYGNAINMLAAKKNNWKIDSPLYNEFIKNKDIERVRKEIYANNKVLKERMRKMKTGIYVKSVDFGDKWPFTVNDGYLDCIGGAAIFRHGYTEYGLNGVATAKGYSLVERIWKTAPYSYGGKVSIGNMIRLACP